MALTSRPPVPLTILLEVLCALALFVLSSKTLSHYNPLYSTLQSIFLIWGRLRSSVRIALLGVLLCVSLSQYWLRLEPLRNHGEELIERPLPPSVPDLVGLRSPARPTPAPAPSPAPSPASFKSDQKLSSTAEFFGLQTRRRRLVPPAPVADTAAAPSMAPPSLTQTPAAGASGAVVVLARGGGGSGGGGGAGGGALGSPRGGAVAEVDIPSQPTLRAAGGAAERSFRHGEASRLGDARFCASPSPLAEDEGASSMGMMVVVEAQAEDAAESGRKKRPFSLAYLSFLDHPAALPLALPGPALQGH
eukprot:gene40464-49318_t